MCVSEVRFLFFPLPLFISCDPLEGSDPRLGNHWTKVYIINPFGLLPEYENNKDYYYYHYKNNNSNNNTFLSFI